MTTQACPHCCSLANGEGKEERGRKPRAGNRRRGFWGEGGQGLCSYGSSLIYPHLHVCLATSSSQLATLAKCGQMTSAPYTSKCVIHPTL